MSGTVKGYIILALLVVASWLVFKTDHPLICSATLRPA